MINISTAYISGLFVDTHCPNYTPTYKSYFCIFFIYFNHLREGIVDIEANNKKIDRYMTHNEFLYAVERLDKVDLTIASIVSKVKIKRRSHP